MERGLGKAQSAFHIRLSASAGSGDECGPLSAHHGRERRRARRRAISFFLLPSSPRSSRELPAGATVRGLLASKKKNHRKGACEFGAT